MTIFGARLRELRKAAGLTQEQLAQAAGVTVSALTKLERGQAEPTWPTATKLAAALGVSVAAFEKTTEGAKAKKGAKR
jgi:transcriptional regulator with XRE-family HTH domain